MSLVSPITNSIRTSTKPTTAGALHDPERHRPAADLLDQAPEDVPAVERQEREQVDHRQREADQREHEQRLAGVELDRLPGDLIAADDAGDLLALLGVEDPPDDR